MRRLTPQQRVNADANAREQRDAIRAGRGSYATCTRCGAPVRWVVRTDMRRIAIDVEPTAQGNIEITAEVRGGRYVALVHNGPLTCPPQNPARYVAHAATCPGRRGS